MMESKRDHWLGFDLGGTKMFAVVFDEQMRVAGRFRQKTHGQRGEGEGVPRILWCIEQALATAGLEPGRLAGIGIGCPGLVDWKEGLLLDSPNLGWTKVRLADAVEEHFRVPARLVNDVDAGTYGEFRQGAGRGAGTLLGVFPGTGLGAGCIVEGKLLRHRRFSCMELGRMRIPSTSLVANDGGLIPVETACSRLAIASACAVEAYRGRAPTVFELAGTDLRKIKSKVLSQAWVQKDPGVVEVVHRALDYLALAIGAAVELLGPDRVVIGGGLIEALPDVIAPLRRNLAAYVTPALLKDLSVVPAELQDLAGAVGAACYVQDTVRPPSGN